MSNYIYFPKISEALGIPDHPIIDDGIPEDAIPMWGGSCSGDQNPMYGKPVSEETRKKISEAKKGKPSLLKGRTILEETKQKISEGMKGNTKWKEGKWRNPKSL